MQTLSDFADEMSRLSRLLDAALTMLKDQTHEYAQAEHDYRKAKAAAFVNAPEGTVPEREAWVAGHTAGQRQRRDLAEGMRHACIEAVRSRRAQISALQSLLAAHRSEAEFVRTGPE